MGDAVDFAIDNERTTTLPTRFRQIPITSCLVNKNALNLVDKVFDLLSGSSPI